MTYKISLTWIGEIDSESAKLFLESEADLVDFLTDNDQAVATVEAIG